MIANLEIRSKTKEDAINKAATQLNVNPQDLQVEILQQPSKGFLGFIGAKDGLYKFTVIEKQVEKEVENAIENLKELNEQDIAKEFVTNILNNLNIDAVVNIVQENNLIKVNIEGKEAGCLIGRRGETLDSIQFLTGLALNKINKDSSFRVLVDIENYRAKREESLIRYANKVAREVAKTRKTKKLDYMNPYERRIIHSALQNDKYVTTYSEGTDPYRRLVIEYKR